MNEKFKLEEAEFFFSQMEKAKDDKRALAFYLDAFLAASRSVMAYALREVYPKNKDKSKERKKKEGLTECQRWFEDLFSRFETLEYFKDKRDQTIHESPVEIMKEAKSSINEYLSVGISGLMIKVLQVDSNGEVIEEEATPVDSLPENSSKTIIERLENGVAYAYIFDDWKGEESILSLAGMHLEELTKVVSEGIEKKYLSGIEKPI